MATAFDADAGVLIQKVAEDLKTKVKAPEWAKFVKTGVSKERPPAQQDWWYVREASILRKIYISGKPIGISRLCKLYKSKKNRGAKPEKTYPASGKVTRLAVQQLEGLGLIRKAKGNKGREITPQGRSYLDKMAKGC